MARFNLVGQLVNDGVQADIHLLLLGQRRGVALRPDVEPDDDRVRGRSQQHVGFVDGADAAAQHTDADLVVGELLQRVGEHFGRAADVGLEDDVELLDLAFLHLLVELFERHAAGLRHGDVARFGFAIN